MSDKLTVAEQLDIQKKLHEYFGNVWMKICPENGRMAVLWAMIELGEVADVIKKRGNEAIVKNPEVRHSFTEEIADTEMFLTDVMLCYDISAEEYEAVYRAKAECNLNRWDGANATESRPQAGERLTIEEQLDIQRRLMETYKDVWRPLNHENGRDQVLWTMIELGEAADVIKKKGDEAIMNDPEVRHSFIEEIADASMFLADVMLCYYIDPEDYQEIFRAKAERNMSRWKKPE